VLATVNGQVLGERRGALAGTNQKVLPDGDADGMQKEENAHGTLSVLSRLAGGEATSSEGIEVSRDGSRVGSRWEKVNAGSNKIR
jgi:hypothetical protein